MVLKLVCVPEYWSVENISTATETNQDAIRWNVTVIPGGKCDGSRREPILCCSHRILWQLHQPGTNEIAGCQYVTVYIYIYILEKKTKQINRIVLFAALWKADMLTSLLSKLSNRAGTNPLIRTRILTNNKHLDHRYSCYTRSMNQFFTQFMKQSGRRSENSYFSEQANSCTPQRCCIPCARRCRLVRRPSRRRGMTARWWSRRRAPVAASPFLSKDTQVMKRHWGISWEGERRAGGRQDGKAACTCSAGGANGRVAGRWRGVAGTGCRRRTVFARAKECIFFYSFNKQFLQTSRKLILYLDRQRAAGLMTVGRQTSWRPLYIRGCKHVTVYCRASMHVPPFLSITLYGCPLLLSFSHILFFSFTSSFLLSKSAPLLLSPFYAPRFYISSWID
jgi:hypothetical protein